ncbi:MAG: hypothetical protein ACPGXW_06080, partial [Synechococcus sp.]
MARTAESAAKPIKKVRVRNEIERLISSMPSIQLGDFELVVTICLSPSGGIFRTTKSPHLAVGAFCLRNMER